MVQIPPQVTQKNLTLSHLSLIATRENKAAASPIVGMALLSEEIRIMTSHWKGELPQPLTNGPEVWVAWRGWNYEYVEPNESYWSTLNLEQNRKHRSSFKLAMCGNLMSEDFSFLVFAWILRQANLEICGRSQNEHLISVAFFSSASLSAKLFCISVKASPRTASTGTQSHNESTESHYKNFPLYSAGSRSSNPWTCSKAAISDCFSIISSPPFQATGIRCKWKQTYKTLKGKASSEEGPVLAPGDLTFMAVQSLEFERFQIHKFHSGQLASWTLRQPCCEVSRSLHEADESVCPVPKL